MVDIIVSMVLVYMLINMPKLEHANFTFKVVELR